MALAEVGNSILNTPASVTKRRTTGKKKTPTSAPSLRNRRSRTAVMSSPNAATIAQSTSTMTIVASQNEQVMGNVEALKERLKESQAEAESYKTMLDSIRETIQRNELAAKSERLSAEVVLKELMQMLSIPFVEAEEPDADSEKKLPETERRELNEADESSHHLGTPLDSPPDDDGDDGHDHVDDMLQLETSDENSDVNVSHETECTQESESSNYAMTSVSSFTPKPQRRGRRRTMALVKGRVLLQKQEDEEESLSSLPTPRLALTATTPSDDTYIPSATSSTSPSASGVELESAVSHGETEERSAGVAIGEPQATKEKVAYNSEDNASKKDNNRLVVEPNNEKEETIIARTDDHVLKQNYDTDSTPSSPTRKKALRRSGRRKTLALHKGALLLSHSTPNSLSSVTPHSEETVMPQSSVTTNSATKQNTVTAAVEIQRSENSATRKHTPQPESTPVRDDTATSVSSVSKSGSALRRSRRKSHMPGKFREDDVVLGYHPRGTSSEGVVSNLASMPEAHSVAEENVGAADIQKTIIRASKLFQTPQLPDDDAAAPQIDEDSATAPTRIGLPPLCPPSRAKATPLIVVAADDPHPPKPRRKRRSSVGVHKGGLLTSKDFEGVMQETMSRKRNRREQQKKLKKGDDESRSLSSIAGSVVNTEAEAQMDSEEVRGEGTEEKRKKASEFSNADLLKPEDHAPVENHGGSLEGRICTPFMPSKTEPIISEGQTAVNTSENIGFGNEPTRMAIAEEEQEDEDEVASLFTEQTLELPSISAADITSRVGSLFPDLNCVTKPCVSARIFAAFTIVAEKTSVSPAKDGTRTRRKRSCRHVQPLLPLLNSIVQAELASLGTDDTADRVEADTSKRVQFCSVDSSSLRPPSDLVAGSHVHLEENIRALYDAVHEAHNICKADGNGNNDDVKIRVNALIRFLQSFQTSSGANLMEECSKSMPQYWPAQRFMKAATIYCLDFNLILSAVEHNKQLGFDSNSLVLEQRLVDFVGRSVRFYLRKFLNPPPLALTTDHDLDSTARSRIHEYFELTVPDGERDTAAADGSVSSIFSTAVRYIYNYFGSQMLTNSGTFEIHDEFCASSVSKRGLGTKQNPIILTDADTDQIISDIQSAHSFLAAVRSCKFLLDLLNWPGVQEEVRRLGGWANVENYSGMIMSLDLERACQDDSYFVLLRDVRFFSQKLEQMWAGMEQHVAPCEDRLRILWKRFRCGTSSKKVLGKNPSIQTIAATLREGSQFTFPSLSTPDYD